MSECAWRDDGEIRIKSRIKIRIKSRIKIRIKSRNGPERTLGIRGSPLTKSAIAKSVVVRRQGWGFMGRTLGGQRFAKTTAPGWFSRMR